QAPAQESLVPAGPATDRLGPTPSWPIGTSQPSTNLRRPKPSVRRSASARRSHLLDYPLPLVTSTHHETPGASKEIASLPCRWWRGLRSSRRAARKGAHIGDKQAEGVSVPQCDIQRSLSLVPVPDRSELMRPTSRRGASHPPYSHVQALYLT